jgi:predicted 3-demethylubiquinone-9 3-methyltransferase (glyoxalase superfamily)
MEADKYPFSERFGWLADRFGVSWQISLSGQKQKISPYLMFTEKASGRAEEAMRLYADIFGETASPDIHLYGEDADAVNGVPGKVMFASFSLAGQSFMTADSAYPHGFTFNEGISFYVSCRDQEEIDALWIRLSEDGEEQSCGWLKDKFGVSWQVVPDNIEKLADSADPVRVGRVNAALMKMGKIDAQTLQNAYDGLN